MSVLLPSRLLRRLLQRLARPGAEDALGDLEEEFGRTRERRGRWAAEAWYTIEATSLLLAMLADKMRTKIGRGRARTKKDFYAPVGREGLMSGWGRDLRHALRGLARDRGTTGRRPPSS